MKKPSNKNQLCHRLLRCHYVTLLVIGTCFTMTAQAAVQDLRVDSLITQAIQTHPLVGSARANQQATTEGINAAKLNLLPTPSVSSGYDRDNDFISQVSIRQPLWTGGKLTADVNQAIFDDKAATEYIYEQQNLVAKTTIDAWQSYIQAIAKQNVHSEALKELSEFEAMMQRRVGQGVSARIELDLVTNRILQEQTAYQAAGEQQRIAAARLEQIIGQPLSQISAMSLPDIKVLVNQAKQQSANFEKMAFEKASFYNPVIVKEHFQIESAKQGVESQQAARYPTVYAQYEHAYYHDDNENDGKFSLGLSYAPGAGFSNLALARASQAQVNSLVQTQEASRRQVIENIQVQYQQFVSAKDRENSLIAAVAGAQIVVNSYRRQFIAGRKSWLEVLNAVREHNDYKVQLVQTRADILGAFHRLQVDFGTMPWQQFGHNRQPVTLFRPTDPVREWINKQDKKAASQRLGYQPEMSDPNEEYIEIRLPAGVEESLNKGERIMLNDDYSITPIVEGNSVN
ncbi:TolC family protein [Psychrobacter alimentarius]|uniref:TolC family protein n=1 Tax=Psychrobacter alimentarius TaxID=261164 RepID=UPI00191A1A1E|nr:TolC family protein [Psychrobacter alimentarius]